MHEHVLYSKFQYRGFCRKDRQQRGLEISAAEIDELQKTVKKTERANIYFRKAAHRVRSPECD